MIFLFNDTATTEIYTLSLHDALPISGERGQVRRGHEDVVEPVVRRLQVGDLVRGQLGQAVARSEEHTSELQSRQYLACRLLLEKKKFQPRLRRAPSFSCRPDTYDACL